MNKQKSNALFLISCVVFTVTFLVYLKLKQQFNNNPYFFYSFHFALGILIVLTLIGLVSRINHSIFGFSLKYKSIDQALNINTEKHLGILLQLPSDELSKIDHKSNILGIKIKNNSHHSATQDNI